MTEKKYALFYEIKYIIITIIIIITIVREIKNELIAGIAALGSSSLGSITIATVPIATTATVPAAGVAGWLGLTTTATTIVAALKSPHPPSGYPPNPQTARITPLLNSLWK